MLGFHVTTVEGPFHENAPVIDGFDDMALSVAVLSIVTENVISMFVVTGTLFAPFAGLVDVTLGGTGPPVWMFR